MKKRPRKKARRMISSCLFCYMLDSIELARDFEHNVGERKHGAGMDISVHHIAVTASFVFGGAIHLAGDELAAAPAALAAAAAGRRFDTGAFQRNKDRLVGGNVDGIFLRALFDRAAERFSGASGRIAGLRGDIRPARMRSAAKPPGLARTVTARRPSNASFGPELMEYGRETLLPSRSSLSERYCPARKYGSDPPFAFLNTNVFAPAFPWSRISATTRER